MKQTESKNSQAESFPKTNVFFDDYGIIIVYLVAFSSLYFSTIFEKPWIILIPIAVFLSYDIWFRWVRKWCIHSRTYEGTIESIRVASQYTSFFIAFIAISLSVAVNANISNELSNFFGQSIIQCYGFIVLAFSGLVLLFIPIPYLDKGNKKEPSRALKNCFFCVLFMEKTIIILLIYLIIQILKHL